jgi:hypothetical protein
LIPFGNVPARPANAVLETILVPPSHRLAVSNVTTHHPFNPTEP